MTAIYLGKNKQLTTPVDKRPFKGKGAEDWLSRLQRDYQSVIDEMYVLSEASKKLSSLPWYLFRHKRSENDQHYLVWRSYGVKQYTITWDNVKPYLNKVPREQKAWVLEAQEQVFFLNMRELTLRFCISRAVKCVDSIQELDLLH